MPGYQIEVTEGAVADLAAFRAFERKEIVQAIRAQLLYEPLTETANRKTLRTNSLEAAWELRIGQFRVFYVTIGDTQVVRIIAIGRKTHNRLFIRGKEVDL